jgi:hypothetical protein
MVGKLLIKTNTIIGILFCSILFCSCCKTKTESCNAPAIDPVFIGFSLQDLDTIHIRMYKAGTHFSTLLDTFKVVKNTGIDSGFYYDYQLFHDTISTYILFGANAVSINSNLYCEIREGYDWVIYLPSVGQTDSISNITSDKETLSYETCACGCKAAPRCSNKITSLVRNGIVSDTLPSSNIYTADDASLFILKK